MKNTLLPLLSFMTIHLDNVTNNRLTGSLCPPEIFLIIFLLIDSLLKCTLSTTYVLYLRLHFADIGRHHSCLFSKSELFLLFIYSVCNNLICLVHL